MPRPRARREPAPPVPPTATEADAEGAVLDTAPGPLSGIQIRGNTPCNTACNAVQPTCHFEKWALHARRCQRWHKAPWHRHNIARATAVQPACMSGGPTPLIPLGRKPALKGCSLRAGSPYLVEAKPREHPPLAWPRPRRARPPSAHRSRQDRPSAR
jgi:hypothetical protein